MNCKRSIKPNRLTEFSKGCLTTLNRLPFNKYRPLVAVIAVFVMMSCAESEQVDRISPSADNPQYWQYKGELVLLLGGSDHDNPFNHPNISGQGLEAHLDLLASVGGNYIRNTMSSRDRNNDDSPFFNDDNIYPFYQDPETGLYDLERFNDEYWDRFSRFLEMTDERDIIVQIEVFDRFDFARDQIDYSAKGWSEQPYNPINNINYTAEEIGLPIEIDTHPGRQENPFFRSTPLQENNTLLLSYQNSFVDKMLSISLEYGHVLYCISNETNESEHWGAYWADFIHDRAEQAGVDAQVTEMWDAHDLMNPMHRHTFDHPERYTFVDISQNNHQNEQAHWDNMQSSRHLYNDPPRPANNIKIYGGERHGGGVLEGTHKFWRNILGGLASSRFHRPGGRADFFGIGLNELAQTHIRSARMFQSKFDIFTAEPNNNLLSNRQENEAYCAATPGEQYAIYFPNGGLVHLDLENSAEDYRMQWLNILKSEWTEQTEVPGGQSIEVTSPGEGQWVAVFTRN